MQAEGKEKTKKRGHRASVPWSRLCCCLVDSVTVHYHYTVAHPLLNFLLSVYIFYFYEKIIHVVFLYIFL